jgi:hypothetical protein
MKQSIYLGIYSVLHVQEIPFFLQDLTEQLHALLP